MRCQAGLQLRGRRSHENPSWIAVVRTDQGPMRNYWQLMLLCLKSMTPAVRTGKLHQVELYSSVGNYLLSCLTKRCEVFVSLMISCAHLMSHTLHSPPLQWCADIKTSPKNESETWFLPRIFSPCAFFFFFVAITESTVRRPLVPAVWKWTRIIENKKPCGDISTIVHIMCGRLKLFIHIGRLSIVVTCTPAARNVPVITARRGWMSDVTHVAIFLGKVVCHLSDMGS